MFVPLNVFIVIRGEILANSTVYPSENVPNMVQSQQHGGSVVSTVIERPWLDPVVFPLSKNMSRSVGDSEIAPWSESEGSLNSGTRKGSYNPLGEIKTE